MTDQFRADRPDPDPGPPVPEDLRELDRLLSSIHFEPRASLGPELIGRLRHEPESLPQQGRRIRRVLGLGAMALGLSLTVALIGNTRLGVARPQIVDQCCFDLDGGGIADDGVLVEAKRDESVRRLTIYEDQDASGGFTAGDTVRFTRGAAPVLRAPVDPALVAFHQCCRDYDGGGWDDDGILVLGVPPDRVVMASIYDQRAPGVPPALR